MRAIFGPIARIATATKVEPSANVGPVANVGPIEKLGHRPPPDPPSPRLTRANRVAPQRNTRDPDNKSCL